MESNIQLTSVFISNGLALLLALQLLNRYNSRFVKTGPEFRILQWMILMSTLACIIDPIVFLSDGRDGTVYRMTVYIGNLILFVDDILVGVGWTMLVCRHLIGCIPKYQKILMIVLCAPAAVALVVNLFTPVVFYVDEHSVYHRKMLFWLFTFIEGVFILDGITVYFYARLKGGIFKFFPVLQFVLPVVLGIAVQGVFYGVSLVYPTAMISFVGLANSFRNEALFSDPLTLLFNRFYLDDVGRELTKAGYNRDITVIMLDVNGFKQINDRCGHAAGDAALIKTAQLLKTTVGALGCVVRYGGDEFIVLLNTKQSEIVDGCVRSIQRAFEEERQRSAGKYRLSVSIGSCACDAEHPTLDDAISGADRAMYLSKKQYYADTLRDRRSRS